MRITTALLLLALPAASAAVPMEFSHQGRLFDGLGAPLSGTHDLTFALYDSAAGTTSLWSEAHTGTELSDGYFSVTLGAVNTLDADDFDGSTLWLGIGIDSGAEIPTRIALVSVPYAVRAGNADRADHADSAETATNLNGGVVNATEIQVNGTTVIDGTGALVTTDLPQHDHDASHLTSGVLHVDRLPIGTSSADVAAGDHLHALSQLTGRITSAQLPTDFDTQVTAVTGAHYTDADAVNAVGPHYDDTDAVAAMGSTGNGNTLNHDRYTNAEAQAAAGSLYGDFASLAVALGFPDTNTDSQGNITGGNGTGPWLLVGGNASSDTGNDLCAALGMEAVGKMWNDVGNGGRQWENTDQACEDTNSTTEWYFDCIVMCAP